MLRLQPGRYVLREPLERESAYLGEDVRAVSGVSRLQPHVAEPSQHLAAVEATQQAVAERA